jgi:hypothetical protein
MGDAKHIAVGNLQMVVDLINGNVRSTVNIPVDPLIRVSASWSADAKRSLSRKFRKFP